MLMETLGLLLGLPCMEQPWPRGLRTSLGAVWGVRVAPLLGLSLKLPWLLLMILGQSLEMPWVRLQMKPPWLGRHQELPCLLAPPLVP